MRPWSSLQILTVQRISRTSTVQMNRRIECAREDMLFMTKVCTELSQLDVCARTWERKAAYHGCVGRPRLSVLPSHLWDVRSSRQSFVCCHLSVIPLRFWDARRNRRLFVCCHLSVPRSHSRSFCLKVLLEGVGEKQPGCFPWLCHWFVAYVSKDCVRDKSLHYSSGKIRARAKGVELICGVCTGMKRRGPDVRCLYGKKTKESHQTIFYKKSYLNINRT